MTNRKRMDKQETTKGNPPPQNTVWKVGTEQEFGLVLKDNADQIFLEGDLAMNVIRIRAVDHVAWLVAFGAIAAAVLLGESPGKAAASAGVGAGIFGLSALSVSSLIGAAAGTAAVLCTYAVVGKLQRTDKSVVLGQPTSGSLNGTGSSRCDLEHGP